MERAKGIEPSYAAWEAAVLPLNYARLRLFLTLRHRLGTNHLKMANYREWTQRRKSGGLPLMNRLGRFTSLIASMPSGRSG
jgi:hypothetical protein